MMLSSVISSKLKHCPFTENWSLIPKSFEIFELLCIIIPSLYRVLFNQDLDTIEANIKSVAEYLAPVHDRVGPKIGDLISAGHETFSRDLDEVCKELDQKLAELNEVLKKLREEYHKFLDPVYQNVIYPFVNMIMTYSVNVFIELREIPVVYAIINDIFEFIAELDSTYGGDIRREWIKIEHAIGPLFEKCEWLQRWKLI